VHVVGDDVEVLVAVVVIVGERGGHQLDVG
jgi:hypothetical protein